MTTMSDEHQQIIAQALEAYFKGEPVDWQRVVATFSKFVDDGMTQEREEQCKQTRLLREIVELLARPDGLGGKAAVRRARRRTRKSPPPRETKSPAEQQ
jgi:hypothetical protein